ncbi:hypothetical protein BDFB_000132 [Asbolus verrucosus]|nr:hypothetical protein BDFB_000132 [Asbolus verrucosus]
MMDFTS